MLVESNTLVEVQLTIEPRAYQLYELTTGHLLRTFSQVIKDRPEAFMPCGTHRMPAWRRAFGC